MKSIVLIAAGITALSSGCATVPAQTVSANDNVDYQHVAAVNNAARGRGVTVYWLRYPQRKTAPDDVVPSPAATTGT